MPEIKHSISIGDAHRMFRLKAAAEGKGSGPFFSKDGLAS